MKRSILIIILAFVFLLSTTGSAFSDYQFIEGTAGDPPPAQSTTGPIPPKGVMPASASPYSPSAAVMISGVPAYLWHHGCGPTAAGMVIGYYDTHGYSWLIPGDASTQTTDVNEAIASENTPSGSSNHYDDYSSPIDNYPDLFPDLSAAPVGDEHVSNSIADFMYTSFSSQSNRYGWSWSNHVGPALVNYVHLKQPAAAASYTNLWWGDSLWSQYQAEINANRPVVFLVDSSGDGNTDHFITGIGYDEVGGVKKYATWDTWSGTVRWQDFVQMQSGKAWGIFQMTALTLSYSNPVPTITQVYPPFVLSGSSDTTIQVTGTGFIETSTVRWNGSDRATTYGSPTSMTAVITAADLLNPTTGSVTVFSPAAGGGTSNTISLLVLDRATFTDRLYLPLVWK